MDVAAIVTRSHRTLVIGIATTLGCAAYLESADESERDCDEGDAACRAAPERGVLVVPDATPPAREVAPAEPPKRPAESSWCPAGTREVHEPEGSCGAVTCEPIPQPKPR